LFIHHSVGRQIIEQGQLRQRLSARAPSLELWDHDYNERGLSDGAGLPTGTSFPIPGDNTDPEGLLAILSGIEAREPWAEHARSFDVLMLKSCFPNNAIHSDAAARSLKGVYQRMRLVARALPQSVLLLSSPPLVLESTQPGETARAADIAAWLGSYWSGPRLSYTDIFDTLTYHSGPARGTLRLGYRRMRPRDSHLAVAGAEAATLAIVRAVGAVLERRRYDPRATSLPHPGDG
jgi:hypothetical protein